MSRDESSISTNEYLRNDRTMPLPLDLAILESGERFQTLCWYLARKEYPRAIAIAVGSFDGGRDICCFGHNNDDIVWQCKFTRRSLSELKPRIIDSLNALDRSRAIAKWILCVSVDGSGKFLDWLRETIARNYPFIAALELWDRKQLLERIEKYPDILEMFFYPAWKALESRFRTEELELIRYEVDPECGWVQPDSKTLQIARAHGTSSDLVIDVIVRSRGTIQSLLQVIRVEVYDVKRHLRGLPGEGLLYAQHTYPISLRAGEPGVWTERMEPPLLVEAGNHERFKVRCTNSGYAWTGFLRLTLLYGEGKGLPLPSTFLRP